MRIEKGGKLTNHSPIHNDIKRVFFDSNNELDYGDFALYIYIAMNVQYGENGRDGKPNGKQGYCYRTKTRMRDDLRMSKDKLAKHLTRLKTYGFIESRREKNRYGGHDLEEFRLSERWKSRL